MCTAPALAASSGYLKKPSLPSGTCTCHSPAWPHPASHLSLAFRSHVLIHGCNKSLSIIWKPGLVSDIGCRGKQWMILALTDGGMELSF